MADKTMAERIMDAADDYQEAMTQTGRKRARAILAALVAEACASEPERVCQWTYQRRRGNWGRGCGGDESVCPPRVFCPDCGGVIELVEGQEVGDD